MSELLANGLLSSEWSEKESSDDSEDAMRIRWDDRMDCLMHLENGREAFSRDLHVARTRNFWVLS
jgi:hypothetical protein